MDTGKIDIHALRPTGVARVLEKFEQRLPYKSLDDKQAKRLISLNSLYQVTKQCNMTTDPDKIYVDQEGYGTLNGLQRDSFYHDKESWKRQGLLQIPNTRYPGLNGGDLFHDKALYDHIRVVINTEGRNLGPMMEMLYEECNMTFNMTSYIPRGEERNQLMGRVMAIQRLFVDAQNICTSSRDEAKKDLDAITSRLPRSPEEWKAARDDLIPAIRGYEMAYSRPEGSEVAEWMRAFIRSQLARENEKPYANQAARMAITNVLVEIQRIGEDNPDNYEINKVVDRILYTWRQIGIDKKSQELGEMAARDEERAMIATAAKIILDSRDQGKKCLEATRQHEPRAIKDVNQENAELRRDLKDLRNQFNQLKQNSANYVGKPDNRFTPYNQQPNRGRGGQGGYNRHPQGYGGPWRPNGGSRDRESTGTRGFHRDDQHDSRSYHQESPTESREKGYYTVARAVQARNIDSLAFSDGVGRSSAMWARVNFDGSYDDFWKDNDDAAEKRVDLRPDQEQQHEEEVPDSINGDCVQVPRIGSVTRAQRRKNELEEKRKLLELQDDVQDTEGQIVVSPKKARTDPTECEDMEREEERPKDSHRVYGPTKPSDQMLSKWAWGTGSAEQHAGEEKMQIWEKHGMDERANYIRLKDVMKAVGIRVKQDNEFNELVHFHIYPGPAGEMMQPMEILGSEEDAKIMGEYRRMKEAENPIVRKGHLEEMLVTRQRLQLIDHEKSHENKETEIRVHQDPEYWWKNMQDHLLVEKLDDALEALGNDPQTLLMDNETFDKEFQRLVSNYMEYSGDFELPPYNEEEALREHALLFDNAQPFDQVNDTAEESSQLKIYDTTSFDYEGTAAVPSSQSLDKVYVSTSPETGWKTMEKVYIKVTPFGLKHAPTEYQQKIEDTILQHRHPDRVAPPEGIRAGAGGAPYGVLEDKDNPDTRSAGLPIPEGCLDRGPFGTWNGQSESGDV